MKKINKKHNLQFCKWGNVDLIFRVHELNPIIGTNNLLLLFFLSSCLSVALPESPSKKGGRFCSKCVFEKGNTTLIRARKNLKQLLDFCFSFFFLYRWKLLLHFIQINVLAGSLSRIRCVSVCKWKPILICSEENSRCKRCF